MTTFGNLLQQLINAISMGSSYALMAIGLAMVFGILRLINFAHGDLIMVGSYTVLFLQLAGAPFWVAALVGIAATTLAGLIMERVAYRPIRGAPAIDMLLTSFAVGIFLENVAILIFTPISRAFPAPAVMTQVLQYGALRISSLDLITTGVTFISLVLLTLFVTHTKVGISMRAVSEDSLGARLTGINVNTVIVAAFAIGSMLAGVSGLLWSARIGKVDPLMGFYPGLKAFIAAVIGGMGSLSGAVLGAYILGFLEVLFQGLLPASLAPFRDAFVFLALIVLLLFRPNGILGRPDTEKI